VPARPAVARTGNDQHTDVWLLNPTRRVRQLLITRLLALSSDRSEAAIYATGRVFVRVASVYFG